MAEPRRRTSPEAARIGSREAPLPPPAREVELGRPVALGRRATARATRAQGREAHRRLRRARGHPARPRHLLDGAARAADTRAGRARPRRARRGVRRAPLRRLRGRAPRAPPGGTCLGGVGAARRPQPRNRATPRAPRRCRPAAPGQRCRPAPSPRSRSALPAGGSSGRVPPRSTRSSFLGSSADPAADPPPRRAAKRRTAHARRVVASFSLGAAGCGGASAEEVVRAWSDALNHGLDGDAGALFAADAIAVSGTGEEVVLRTQADATRFNASLPCQGGSSRCRATRTASPRRFSSISAGRSRARPRDRRHGGLHRRGRQDRPLGATPRLETEARRGRTRSGPCASGPALPAQSSAELAFFFRQKNSAPMAAPIAAMIPTFFFLMPRCPLSSSASASPCASERGT